MKTRTFKSGLGFSEEVTMKRSFYFILTVLSLSGFAIEEVWKLGDNFLSFEKDTEKNWLYSRNCQNQNCEALIFLKKASFKNISAEDLNGGKNPGAVICHKNSKAKVVILKDLDGNENSFCLFSDKSMVSNSTLYKEAKVNDEKK